MKTELADADLRRQARIAIRAQTEIFSLHIDAVRDPYMQLAQLYLAVEACREGLNDALANDRVDAMQSVVHSHKDSDGNGNQNQNNNSPVARARCLRASRHRFTGYGMADTRPCTRAFRQPRESWKLRMREGACFLGGQGGSGVDCVHSTRKREAARACSMLSV